MNPYAFDFFIRRCFEGDIRHAVRRDEGTQCQRRTAMMRVYASKLRRRQDIKELERECMEASE